MAEVKHLVLKADGSKTELGTSDVLLFPKINGNPESNPPINYSYLYILNNGVYEKNTEGIITKLGSSFGTTGGTSAEGNDSRLSDARTPLGGSANYIQNQNTSAQFANIWINGSGVFGSSVTATSLIKTNGQPNEYLMADGSVSTFLAGVLSIIQVTAQTLTLTSWVLVDGLYEYNLANTNITETSVVDVIPDNASVSIIQTAQVLPKTLSGAGTVKLYATNAPTGDITVTLNIWK